MGKQGMLFPNPLSSLSDRLLSAAVASSCPRTGSSDPHLLQIHFLSLLKLLLCSGPWGIRANIHQTGSSTSQVELNFLFQRVHLEPETQTAEFPAFPGIPGVRKRCEKVRRSNSWQDSGLLSVSLPCPLGSRLSLPLSSYKTWIQLLYSSKPGSRP